MAENQKPANRFSLIEIDKFEPPPKLKPKKQPMPQSDPLDVYPASGLQAMAQANAMQQEQMRALQNMYGNAYAASQWQNVGMGGGGGGAGSLQIIASQLRSQSVNEAIALEVKRQRELEREAVARSNQVEWANVTSLTRDVANDTLIMRLTCPSCSCKLRTTLAGMQLATAPWGTP